MNRFGDVSHSTSNLEFWIQTEGGFDIKTVERIGGFGTEISQILEKPFLSVNLYTCRCPYSVMGRFFKLYLDCIK